ncbi:hypothetical protein [Staphylococcus haemolyticus]|uniref:hypothetical protein n=1 Tax=Staphylococcus haemolyticus TaxID=1283 RepID=UPI001F1A9D17|nr:hypothetical protein [Staphylococcus haemolyticus]MCE4992338.1 hypothetical protein [Staphylococcus haemolyticus]
MSVTIGIILIIVLLILSLVPNYKAMQQAKSQGQKSTRFTIMVGIDLILLVLLVVTIILKLFIN